LHSCQIMRQLILNQLIKYFAAHLKQFHRTVVCCGSLFEKHCYCSVLVFETPWQKMKSKRDVIYGDLWVENENMIIMFCLHISFFRDPARHRHPYSQTDRPEFLSHGLETDCKLFSQLERSRRR